MNESSSYKIDPCKATLKHLKKTGYTDYNNVNSLCYETCAHWFGPDSNAKGTECYKMCNQCVVPFLEKRGHDTCYFKPRPPAVFNKPAFFKTMFERTGDKEKALHLCKQMCNDSVDSSGRLQCIQTCEIDADALILNKQEERNPDFMKASKKDREEKKKERDRTIDEIVRKNPASFYITFIVLAIIFAVVLTLFIRVLVV